MPIRCEVLERVFYLNFLYKLPSSVYIEYIDNVMDVWLLDEMRRDNSETYW